MQAVGFIKGFLTPDRSTTVGADESRTTSAPPATSAAESPQRLLSVVQESQEPERESAYAEAQRGPLIEIPKGAVTPALINALSAKELVPTQRPSQGNRYHGPHPQHPPSQLQSDLSRPVLLQSELSRSPSLQSDLSRPSLVA